MSNWLSKIFSTISSLKMAFIALLTCCLLIIFWQETTSLIKLKGVSDEFISLLIFLIFYSLSYLIIELSYLFYNQCLQIIKWMANQFTMRSRKIKFQEKVNKILPQLPKNQIDILIQLISADKNICLSDVTYLEKLHFVIKTYQVDQQSFIYAINPIIKDELQRYLSEKKSKKINVELSTLSQNERDFFSLVFSEQMETTTSENSVKMKNERYRATEDLVNIEL
jgi:hypothetical protein